MKPSEAPRLERRRAADFERELLSRARTWIPDWSLDESEPDFGLALLKVAARFGSEVAERLDKVGDKMALGFLDWLALRGAAARPARMPVVLKLAGTAREPVTAPLPVKMQVDVHDATVTFETESELRVVPGTLDAVVAVDPANDAYFLSPPGLGNLDPQEPLPTAWRVKNFAAAGSKLLQLDPGLGLAEGMLIELAGAQYRILNAKDDLVTIDPEVPSGGFAEGTRATKVEVFTPFSGARNRQEHILYLGDPDWLNVDAAARIELRGLPTLPAEVAWEYWGKDDSVTDPNDADPRWRALVLEDEDDPEALIVKKPKGAIEPTQIGTAEGRWVRARLLASVRAVEVDKVSIRINPREDDTSPPPALTDPALRSELPPLEAMVNSTASPTSSFYLLGREPRLFDTLYLGSAEAFSKPGATAWIMFELSDGVFDAMTAFDGWLLGRILAGVDRAGALHLFSIGANGELSRLGGRQPLQPPGAGGSAGGGGERGVKLTSASLRPAMWLNGFAMSVAVVAQDHVWVWTEAPPFLGVSGWQDWGSVPSDDPTALVEGLVSIDDGGTKTVAALRNGVLFKSVRSGTPDWVDITPNLAANEEVVGIAGLREEVFNTAPSRLLVIAEKTTNQKCTLYSVAADNSTTSLIPNVVKDVAPFGVERAGGNIEVVAVEEGAARKLVAKSGASAAVTAALEPQVTIDPTSIDGHLEGGQLVAYCRARNGTNPILLSWLPFDAALTGIVLSAPIDTGQGAADGPITVAQNHAYIPGTSRGDIFAAPLGQRSRFLASAATFRSAIAYSLPAPAALGNGDTVMVPRGTGFETARIDAVAPAIGSGAFSGSAFFWLDKWIDRNDQPVVVLIYPTSAGGTPGVVTQPGPVANSSTLTLAAALPETTKLLVSKGPPGSGAGVELVEITELSGLDATVEPALTAGDATAVEYWVPTSTTGRVFPAFKLDLSNNGFESSLLRSGDIFFPALDPQRQHAIALTNHSITPSRPEWIAFEAPWVNQAAPAQFIVDAVVSGWAVARTDSSANPALAWEYWNGTGWWRLPIDDDETSNFRNSGVVRFRVPFDLKPTDWSGKTNHWVRARLIGGDYGQETVKVVTKPIGGGQTEQTVVRTTEGVQPPYALNVSVAYAVDQEAVPRFLLTRDSGTLRDQSDANRTPGAEVEIFMPLLATLARFDAPASDANGGAQCASDCDCSSGTASNSPVSLPGAAAPSTDTGVSSRGGRRALYLGFTGKLLGEPINLLFLSEKEGAYDRIAPLAVDALIGDRLTPIVAADETRALGETGLLKMAFNVEPIQAELFGRTLSWLRLTPSGGDADWQPSLAGVYPNAVWARAAETMTRELLGSSDGRPALSLAVTRPPLLQDTLELRVREPLGEEERQALLDRNPELVKSAIPDLPGDWVLWTQVPDPVDCTATDRVYALDEVTGTIRFGDGLHGKIPPAGVDAVVAFAYQRTEPAVGGEVPANFVLPRTELNLVTPVESVETVIAADRSAGGLPPESPERVLRFAPATLRHRGRAVSAQDFEDLARQNSADVVQARCFVRNGRIRLVVVMRGASPWPSNAQRRELRRMLLEIAPVSLAAPDGLAITGPTVRKLRIAIVLRVATLDVAGTVAKQAKDRLLEQFDIESGGESGDGWPMGSGPQEDDVARTLLDLPELDGIVSISLFEVDELGAEQPWAGEVGRRELVMLAPDDVRIGFEVVEGRA